MRSVFTYAPKSTTQLQRVLARKLSRPPVVVPEPSVFRSVEDLIGYCRRSGMGGQAIAEEAGVANSTVYKMMDNKTVPRLKTLEAIAGVFGKRIGLVNREPRS
jgi:transcriptional regulator with XRE-family HTH domain